MSEFKAETVCILGRQPAMGLAELESLYGAGHVRPFGSHALLDVPAEEINFKKLGGTIKVAKILDDMPAREWKSLSSYLIDTVPRHVKKLPDGKFTLGLSIYGLETPIRQIEAVLLEIKKLIRQSGRPVRIVPNKSTALNSAQVLHNKLTHKGAWELILIIESTRSFIAQTLFVQDIDSYAARDQARPYRDSRVGMLPPKLAQIIINLSAGTPAAKDQRWDDGDGLGRFLVLDPFCGTGVILQEALLMGYSAYGTDIETRMADYSKRNLQWLVENNPSVEGKVIIEAADATRYHWLGFSCIASEVYLGRPLASLPAESAFKQIVSDTNTVIKKFLANLLPQVPSSKTGICLALPAWRRPDGSLIKLPLIDHLTDMGYTYADLKHVRREDLVYYREGQVVARQILRLRKK